MNYFRKKFILGLFIAILIFFLGFFSKDFYSRLNSKIIPSVKPANILLPEPKAGVYKVVKVLDGDTIEIETGEKIRLLGIDAPEINNRWGPEAKKFNEDLLLGKQVKIELDKILLDKYGRLLAYVWIDGKMVNEAILEEGYAKLNTIKGEAKLKYFDRLKIAEGWGKDHHNGVWLDDWIN